MAVVAQSPKTTALAAWKAWPLVDGTVATAEVLRPLDDDEAPRIGVIGDSGCGKTEAERQIAEAWLKRQPGIVLALDDKELRARFPGQERRDLSDVTARPPAPEPRLWVLRGEPRHRIRVDYESAARWAWSMAGLRTPTLVIYDEITRAAHHQHWRKGKASLMPDIFGQGRAVGISSVWGTQSPQDVPREAFEQSSALLCFRLAGLGLNSLIARDYIPKRGPLADVVQSLPGDDVPKAQRGYFVLLRRGRPWDQKIYRYRVAAAA